MTFDLDALRSGYRDEYPIYRDLVAKAEVVIIPFLREVGVEPHVDGRAKEVPNFVLKAISKHSQRPEDYPDPLRDIKDKAGIRILVAALDEVALAVDAAQRAFDLVEPFEDTAQRYEPSTLGYLGHHGQARIRVHDLTAQDDHLRGREFEIQIHTRAQNAWSTVSHPLLYKPVGGDPAPDVARKVYRAVALVSLFDEQLKEARMAVKADTTYRPAAMLAVLRKLFVPWMAGETDEETSLWILANLADLWPPDDFEEVMKGFVASKRDTLDLVYSRYGAHVDAHPLLLQPEALAIYERLVSAPAALAATWIEHNLPVELLESLKDVFG